MHHFFTTLFKSHTSSHFLPLALIRITFGLFFFASGFNKLFLPEHKAMLLETITKIGIFLPELMAPFVAFSEAVFGLTLALGLMTRPSALVLLIINIVALLTVAIHYIPAGETILGWYSWLLYLPESPYILFCILLIVQGCGPWGLDHKLLQWFGVKHSA